MTLDDRDIHSLAAPYALDALDDLDRRRFEDHLDAGCDTCTEEVAGYLATAAVLGSGEEVPISDSLRAAVADVPDTVRQVGPALRRRRAGVAARRWALAAAAVLAVVAGGLGAVVVDQQQRLDTLAREVTVATILRQPDAAVVTATTGDDDGVVRVVSSVLAGDAAVIVAGLEPLPSDRAYQLWLIDADGAAASAGLLEVDTGGTAEQVIAEGLGDATAVGVSVEPAGGSVAPTTTPIAVATLG